MTSFEAYDIVSKTIPSRFIVQCIEYDSAFVFKAPRKLEWASQEQDCLFIIDKITKKVGPFNPMSMPLDEYLRGKPVTGFGKLL